MTRPIGVPETWWTIALAVVAVAASAVADDLRPTRIETNEAAAIASLREIAAAQAKFQASGVCDVEGDGVGEFGLLRELTGAVGVRTVSTASTQGNVLDPPLLSAAYRRSDHYSDVLHEGYRFRVFLPGWIGIGDPEISSGSLQMAVDVDYAETTWCCYAWPDRHGVSGRRAFFVNQTGEIVATDQASYSGVAAFASPNAGAALRSGGAATDVILGTVAVGTVGRDNNFWRAVVARSADVEQSVRGRLTSVELTSHVTGTFEIASRRLTSSTSETIAVRAGLLRHAPACHIVLVAHDGTSADFGKPFSWASTTGAVRVGFNSEFHSYPDGVASLTDFGGGTIELRVDGSTIARGPIPEFVAPAGPNAPNAFARWRGRSTLAPTFPGDPGRGVVTAELTNEPRGTRQRLLIEIDGLDDVAPPWDFAAASGVDAWLATRIATKTHRGGASRLIDSRRRGDFDDFSGRGLVGVSGVRMYVFGRHGGVLTGTFPVVE